QSEGNVVDEQAYDWSDVKLRPKTADDIKEWMHMFNEQWNASGICPDPNMYEVQNSDWITSTRDSNLDGYKQLLLLGEEMYVEVLCKHWTWVAGEWIDWSKESH
ncbi:MAG: hypothetical protein JNJ61_01330, partial [Anaerolineae bacterium]|nr:hypothetical protein [Anaerolineae bacterium]